MVVLGKSQNNIKYDVKRYAGDVATVPELVFIEITLIRLFLWDNVFIYY